MKTSLSSVVSCLLLSPTNSASPHATASLSLVWPPLAHLSCLSQHPFITPMPPVHWFLDLSSCHCLLLLLPHLVSPFALAGCFVESNRHHYHPIIPLHNIPSHHKPPPPLRHRCVVLLMPLYLSPPFFSVSLPPTSAFSFHSSYYFTNSSTSICIPPLVG